MKLTYNLVILAAGPPKPNRNRHLEIYQNQPLISNIINNLPQDEVYKVHVVVNKNNDQLIDYLKKYHPLVNVIYPKDEKIRSTFEVALKNEGPCILICGDSLNVKTEVIQDFINSPLKSCSCHYKTPWGNDYFSSKNNIRRRGDVGDVIQKIGQDHKKEFLSEGLYKKAVELFYEFYPNGNHFSKIDEYHYNDIGTFTSFVFYENLWSEPGAQSTGTKGLITINYNIYEDND